MLSSVQLLCLGVLGEYVGSVHRILQDRPTYLVSYDSDDTPAFEPSAVTTQR